MKPNEPSQDIKGKWSLTDEDLVLAVKGRALLSPSRSQLGDRSKTIHHGVGTDTREDLSHKIFFALKGANHDAHDFLDKAVQQGASALVVERPISSTLLNQVTVVQVPSVLTALQDLSKWWRQRLRCQISAVTGSNGKTSTKEFAGQIIQRHFRTDWSRGSFNNHIGVPLTLLSFDRELERGIVEIGMNHRHEIEELVKLAAPDAVVVTMVGQAHIENLGSVEEIARAKNEIYEFSPPSAHRIFNVDNPWTKKMLERFSGASASQNASARSSSGSFSTFSTENPQSDFFLRVDEVDESGFRVRGHLLGVEKKTRVPLMGPHNIVNVLAAAAMAAHAGVSPADIWLGLEALKTTWGRNQLVSLSCGAKLIFDGYNANPESMAALLNTLSSLSHYARRFLVLGEMKELGDKSPQLHFELGKKVAALPVDGVWFFGPHAPDFERGLKEAGYQKTAEFSDSYKETIASKIKTMLNPQDVVLVKGSRGVQLERVVQLLEPIDFQKPR